MSDIVDELLDRVAFKDDLEYRAADEIGRLRSMLRNCYNILKDGNYLYARDVGKVIDTWK